MATKCCIPKFSPKAPTQQTPPTPTQPISQRKQQAGTTL